MRRTGSRPSSLWQFQRPLEDYFTLVNYDQRGAGKTYREDHSDAVGETIRIQQYVDDLVEVAEHAREKLGKDKLVLMAHSWGTIPATRAALARPDLFHAYVGIGQVINVRDNERISIEYGLEQARRPARRAVRGSRRSCPTRRRADHARTHHRRAQVAATLRRAGRSRDGTGLYFPAPRGCRRTTAPRTAPH